MHIAYGVMGYGRGHAMRVAAVLPSLQKQHKVTIFAGGDAAVALRAHAEVVEIPTIAWQYSSSGRISPRHTIARNMAPMSELLFAGASMQFVQDEFRRRGIDLVISDSEAWTHRAAQALKIPRISFDHVGIMAYCNPPLPRTDWLNGHRDALGYRSLMGVPEHIIVSSFYPALPRYSQVQMVGPVLRERVLQTHATGGEHLLAYFNKGEHQFNARIQALLNAQERPVIVYGVQRDEVVGNIRFKMLSETDFVHDLASCHALLSTSGNQLLSEAIYFQKPVLTMPENCFEQRLNAFMVGRMGVGRVANLHDLQADDIAHFLDACPAYREALQGRFQDGRAEAVDALQGAIASIQREQSNSRRKVWFFNAPSLALQ